MPTRLRSHHVVLDRASRQVRVGEELISAEPKVLELLAYLMTHNGRVVTKGELLDSIWGGEVVGESVLSRCVSHARTLLSDDARQPRFVRTVHGRGYQFIAQVQEESTADTRPSRHHVDAIGTGPVSRFSRDDSFVGRAEELAVLRTIIESPRFHGARLVVVQGEAGIGKTRLLEEATQTARPDVHWAQSPTTEDAPPFFLWRQCFRSIVRERSRKSVLSALGGSSNAAHKVLFGPAAGQRSETVGWNSATERFRVFDAIAQTLNRLALHRQMIIVIDDIHRADRASLLLLGFVIEQLEAPLLVLAAARPTAAFAKDVPPDLGALGKGRTTELVLRRFTLDEVSEFATHRALTLDATAIARLWERTAGNPLFLSLLATRPASNEDLPLAVRHAVAERLAGLPAAATQLLQFGAVYGREFLASVVGRAIRCPIDQTLQELGRARNLGILVSDASGRFRFTHDLVREALYHDMAPAQVAEAHLAVGNVLASLPDFQGPRHAGWLAYHYAQAVSCGGGTAALDASVRAGAYALGHFAYEDAATHFERAVAMLPFCRDVDVDGSLERAILLDLGLAQVSSGAREAGTATLQLAAMKARESGAFQELATVALNLAPGLMSCETGVCDPSLVALLREALLVVSPDDLRRRALLGARLAIALYWSDTYDERVELCDEADRLAQRLGSEEVKVAVITARAFALFRPGNMLMRKQLLAAGIDLAARIGDQPSLLLHHLAYCALLRENADWAGASYQEDAFRRLAEDNRQPHALWIAEAHRALHLYVDGHLAEVETIVGGWVQTATRIHDHNAQQSFGVLWALVCLQQGRADEVVELIRDYAARYPRVVAWRVFHAYALMRAARPEARSAYLSLKADAFAVPEDLLSILTMCCLAELCYDHRDAEGAATVHGRLLAYADRLVVVGYGIGCLGSVEHYLGLACAVADLEAATVHLEKAIAVHREIGAGMFVAMSLYAQAQVLNRIGNDVDRVPALLREAVQLAAARGLTHLLAQVESYRAQTLSTGVAESTGIWDPPDGPPP